MKDLECPNCGATNPKKPGEGNFAVHLMTPCFTTKVLCNVSQKSKNRLQYKSAGNETTDKN